MNAGHCPRIKQTNVKTMKGDYKRIYVKLANIGPRKGLKIPFYWSNSQIEDHLNKQFGVMGWIKFSNYKH